jgi:hypothetical protein
MALVQKTPTLIISWRARGIDGECSTVLALWPICRLHEIVE